MGGMTTALGLLSSGHIIALRDGPLWLGLVNVKAPASGIDILPPDAVQFAHAEARVDQYAGHITVVFGEDLKQAGDDVVAEWLRYILVLFGRFKRWGGVFSEVVETMGLFEYLIYRT